ncbi:MAG: hypothetical protein OEU74_07210 [Gammaproteobacteria bacterium]|jgi:hypothetical protein|nr:hypothetical protein [Gammaproteobacteria bacterium]
MRKILDQPGNMSQWQALVVEAEELCGIQLDEELESYLVFTLMRYLRRPEMAHRILALDFLEAQQSSRQHRSQVLRDVGDQCLLFSGLFPRRAERRRVRVSYYVDLGRSAYQNLADSLTKTAHLFAHLAEEFIAAMDTLQAIRVIGQRDSGLLPIEAYELWQDTASRQAYEQLLRQTGGRPVLIAPSKKPTCH